MNNKKQILSICMGIIIVVVLAFCVISVLQDKSAKTSSTDTMIKEVKTLKAFYFEDSDSIIAESIIKIPEESITYSNYNILLDSYIYDSITDTGYALIKMTDNTNRYTGLDLEQKFYELFEFKFMHQGYYFEASTPRIITDNNTLYLYYMLQKHDNKIIIWDNQTDSKAAEFTLENTCESDKELETSDGRKIKVSPIGMKISTEKITASSEFVYNETTMSEEDLEEYFNDGISQIDILFKNGNRVTVYGGEVSSRASIDVLDGEIERTIRVSRIIDVENIDSIEIK